MVHVGIPRLGFQVVVALAVGYELGGANGQQQNVVPPVLLPLGLGVRQGTTPGSYVFVDPGPRGGPIYAILDGVTPETAAGISQFGRGFPGRSAIIVGGQGPQAATDVERTTGFQISQSPSQQSVQQLARNVVRASAPQDAATLARMMRIATSPANSPEAVQAPVQVSVQRVATPSAPQTVASVPAPVAQTYQAPPVRISAPIRANPAPVLQRTRQSTPASVPVPPARANQPAIRAPPDSGERVTIAQVIPTQIPTQITDRIPTQIPNRQALTSIINDVTGTQTGTQTGTATATGTATTSELTETTTTNGKLTTTTSKFTSTPSLIPGSAVSLIGRPDRLLLAVVLGFVGIEVLML